MCVDARLLGIWSYSEEESFVTYSITKDADDIKISAWDSYSGKKILIGDIRHQETFIQFNTLFSDADHTAHVRFELRYGKVVSIICFSGTTQIYKVNKLRAESLLCSVSQDEPKIDQLVGLWRTVSDDWSGNIDFLVIKKDEGLTISLTDHLSLQTLIVRNVRFEGSSLYFEAELPEDASRAKYSLSTDNYGRGVLSYSICLEQIPKRKKV